MAQRLVCILFFLITSFFVCADGMISGGKDVVEPSYISSSLLALLPIDNTMAINHGNTTIIRDKQEMKCDALYDQLSFKEILQYRGISRETETSHYRQMQSRVTVRASSNIIAYSILIGGIIGGSVFIYLAMTDETSFGFNMTYLMIGSSIMSLGSLGFVIFYVQPAPDPYY